jgi:hypothetical protein
MSESGADQSRALTRLVTKRAYPYRTHAER